MSHFHLHCERSHALKLGLVIHFSLSKWKLHHETLLGTIQGRAKLVRLVDLLFGLVWFYTAVLVKLYFIVRKHGDRKSFATDT